MLIKDLQKPTPVVIKKTVSELTNLLITNVLVKKYLKIEYQVVSKYLRELDEIGITGTINFEVLAIDARDGKEFHHQQTIA
jgi:hypothetical protein